MGYPFFFFIAGTATLIFETFYIKKNLIIFGSTFQATGMLLCAYFLGIGLGSLFWGKKKVESIAIERYVAFFIGALLFSFLLPVGLNSFYPLLYHAFHNVPFLLVLLKFVLVLLAMFPVCFFIGGFFPLAAQCTSGQNLTLLYGLNGLGSVLGIVLGSFLLPYLIGYNVLFGVTVLLFLAGLIIFFKTPCCPVQSKAQGQSKPMNPGFLTIAFFSGFLTILLEVVWIRQISIGTDNTLFAFGSATILILAFIFIVSLLVSKLPDGLFQATQFIFFAMVFSCIGLLVSSFLFIKITGGLKTTVIGDTHGFLSALLFSVKFLLPGVLFPLCVFPLIIRHISTRLEDRGSAYGKLFAVNSMGCALGALFGGFFFAQILGMWGTLLFCALFYTLMPLLLPKNRFRYAAIGICLILVLIFNPRKNPNITADPLSADFPAPAKMLWEKEGGYGIVSVIDFGKIRTLWLNSSYVLGSNKSTVDDRRMGLLPFVLNPESKNAAVIGIATGITASGLLNTGLESITLVELIPEVREAAQKFYTKDHQHLFSDTRVKAIMDDGRNYFKVSRQTFDLIVSDLFVPWHEGTSFLYTVEHFRQVKARLSEKGLFCLWLPAYELTEEEFYIIARSFAFVFPNSTLWQNNFNSRAPVLGLVGTASLSVTRINAEIEKRSQQPHKDLIEKHPAALFSRYLGPINAEALKEKQLPLNTLNRPVIEFMSAKKGRRYLSGIRYIDFAKDYIQGLPNPQSRYFDEFTDEMRQYQRAGIHMVYSFYYLKSGNRQEAYKHFDLFKSMTPEAIHAP